MIRVGVDVWNMASDRRGIGRYVRSILGAWADEDGRIEVTLVVPERATWIAARRYRAELDGRPYRVLSRPRLRRRDLDVLWFPFNGPSWRDAFGGPAVATLHDASTFVLPGFDDAARATFRAAVQRCERLITDSAFSAAELGRELGVPAARLTPIPLGVAPPRRPTRTALDPRAFGRFVLCVGAADARKNVATVEAAVALAAAHAGDLRLVVIGTRAGSVPISAPPGLVRYLGAVDDDTLAAFYRAASAFVYASAYEGFGLPILEAMSYGVPVVAAASSSLAEAGGDAALYAATYDARAFARALERILSDRALADELGARGRARAAAMTWSITAHRTLAVFESVAGKV